MTPPPRLSLSDALFLDFDGTLSPLVDDPRTALLHPRQHELLLTLAEALGGALAIVSGRALDDLSARVPEGLQRIGGHGLQTAAPGEAASGRPASPPELRKALRRAIQDFPGTRLEPKGPVFAIHYRAAPELRVPLGNALGAALAEVPGYALHGGKLVYEAKPEGADKGAALTRMMATPPFAGRRPVMVGDDVTDEDGFAAAAALGGHGIKVGPGPTKARFRISGIPSLWTWLADPADPDELTIRSAAR